MCDKKVVGGEDFTNILSKIKKTLVSLLITCDKWHSVLHCQIENAIKQI